MTSAWLIKHGNSLKGWGGVGGGRRALCSCWLPFPWSPLHPPCRVSPQALLPVAHWPFRVGWRQRLPAPEWPCLLNSHALKISVQSFFLPSLQSPPSRICLTPPNCSPGEGTELLPAQSPVSSLQNLPHSPHHSPWEEIRSRFHCSFQAQSRISKKRRVSTVKRGKLPLFGLEGCHPPGFGSTL